jgi:hypothetical protein
MIEQIISQMTNNTKKIKVGVNVYGELKRTLGSFADKLKGIDFELDESLEQNSFKLE